MVLEAALLIPACAAAMGPRAVVAMAPVEWGALVVLVLALAALGLALRAAGAGPGGLRSLFRGGHPRAGEAERAAEELRTLIAEASALADELAERFDERAAGLARLLREAEERTARLEQVMNGAGRAGRGGVEREVEAKPAGPVPAPSGDPMAREIYRLADEGLGPVEIATRLGQHTGKVELILALRRA